MKPFSVYMFLRRYLLNVSGSMSYNLRFQAANTPLSAWCPIIQIVAAAAFQSIAILSVVAVLKLKLLAAFITAPPTAITSLITMPTHDMPSQTSNPRFVRIVTRLLLRGMQCFLGQFSGMKSSSRYNAQSLQSVFPASVNSAGGVAERDVASYYDAAVVPRAQSRTRRSHGVYLLVWWPITGSGLFQTAAVGSVKHRLFETSITSITTASTSKTQLRYLWISQQCSCRKYHRLACVKVTTLKAQQFRGMILSLFCGASSTQPSERSGGARFIWF